MLKPNTNKDETENELDELDRSILKNLQKNARISNSKLAKLINSNESTIRFRIKRLEEKKIISVFTVLINPRKVGLPIVLTSMIRVTSNMMDFAFRKIADMKEIFHAFQCTGKYDLFAIFHATDMNHVNEISKYIKGINGIIEVEDLIATGMIKINTDLDF
ncbi:MAG: Lrp/AsnC family transcriptional regulator [Promethearchaeota archaeon]